jgi:4-carboxymuconolactone decarboxylase
MNSNSPGGASKASLGAERRARAQGIKHQSLQDALATLDPGVAEWANEFIFGQVWGRPGLTHEERMLVAIVALAATEHPNQLRNYLHGALQDGMDGQKIHEALTMLVVYCGFPTALEALVELHKVQAIEGQEPGSNGDAPRRQSSQAGGAQ